MAKSTVVSEKKENLIRRHDLTVESDHLALSASDVSTLDLTDEATRKLFDAETGPVTAEDFMRLFRTRRAMEYKVIRSLSKQERSRYKDRFLLVQGKKIINDFATFDAAHEFAMLHVNERPFLIEHVV